MADTFLQFGSMNFDEIRSNLKSFMQDQNELDFDFDGSIASTVLDLLSYNTMYYAFYSNMLINESYMESAQRLESLISLVKPFGYAISHKASASVNLDIRNNSTSPITIEPYLATFSSNLNGVNYVFYYTGGAEEERTDNTIVLGANNDAATLPIYQGKSVVIKLPMEVDYNAQTVEIKDKNVDIRTLRVYVEETTAGLQQYTRVQNTNSSIDANSKVYFLETTNKGYKIFFGAAADDEGNQIGRGVGKTETVFISYVISSGDVANTANTFTTSLFGVSITNSPMAAGGFNSPNLDTIKFLAPREFSSGGRLVSASDYEKIIQEQNEINVNQNNIRNNISAYGSDQTGERTGGKVYFSLFDENTVKITSQPQLITDNIKHDVMVGLTLQYKEPTDARISFVLEDSNVNGAFNQLYNRGGNAQTTGFNQTIKASDIGTVAGANGGWKSATVEVTPYGDNTIIIPSATNTTIDLKNKLTIDQAGSTFSFRGYADGDSSYPFVGGFSGTDRSTLIVNQMLGGIPILMGVGTTLGTADLDRGYVNFNLNLNAATQTAYLYGLTANYDSTSRIEIKHELLGTPIV